MPAGKTGAKSVQNSKPPGRPLRSAISPAMVASAISAGVREPMFSPIGRCTRAICSSGTPSAASAGMCGAGCRGLPRMPTQRAGLLAGRDGADHGAGHDAAEHHGPGPEVLDALAALDGLTTVTALDGLADETTDVVVTDHHRPELGMVLRDALASPARWVGILGNPRHPAPHIPALAALGVPDDQIARVHRPIGLNIGSRTPAEIALATMAGLIADRNGRPGGFEF